MATQRNNLLTKGLTGSINRQLLFKQYAYGTVVSKMPDRSKVILSDDQKKANRNFQRAVAYAKSIINDPVKKASYLTKVPPGKTIYHYAIREYLKTETGDQGTF